MAINKFLLFSFFIANSINLSGMNFSQEERLKKAYKKLCEIQVKKKTSKGMLELFYTKEENRLQEQINTIKKILPEGQGNEIIKKLKEELS